MFSILDIFTIFDDAITEGLDNAVAYNQRLKDNGDNYSLKIDIPGFEREEINIDIIDNLLKLKAKNVEGSKSLSFYVPRDINKDKVEASLKNGRLTIILPKKSKDPPNTVKVRIG
jgi:HSP20 family protein